jgi:hypothetical protein
VDQLQHLSVLNISNQWRVILEPIQHPLENPTYFTNVVELWAQLIILMRFSMLLSLKKRSSPTSRLFYDVSDFGF